MDIIFDIDGTVANLDHRLHLVKNDKPDWEKFHQLVGDDSVIEQMKAMYDILTHDAFPAHRVLFASGRSETCRGDTEDWLERHGFAGYTKLYMRPEFDPNRPGKRDTRPDTEIKAEMYEQMKADGYDPKICFDDRLRVSRTWAELGVFCFCVNQGLKDY